MTVDELSKLLFSDRSELGDLAVAAALDGEVDVACRGVVGIGAAFVVVHAGNGLALIEPDGVLIREPCGEELRVRLDICAIGGGCSVAVVCLRLGGGRKGGCRSGDQDSRQNERDDGCFLRFHNCCDPFFNGIFTEAVAKGRDAAARFHHADEGARIVRPRAAETVHDCFVARELEVTVREHVHDPHERIEPVDADGGDERELGERVEALDVDKLVLQNEAQSALVRPVGRLRHQNDGAQDAERQRGRDAVRLADDELAAQRMRCKPAAGIVVFDRQRGLEFAIAPDVEHRKCQRTDLNAHKPDDCPRQDRRRGRRSDLRRDGDGCRRQDRRRRDGGGIRYRRCLTRKQRVDAQARGERERHKQPHERERPEHQKRLFRHLVERQRAENGDDRDHHRAVQAHLQKAHPFTLIPARRRSS